MSNSMYSADGVHIEAGDDFSSFCGRICRGTYNLSLFVGVTDLSSGRFRGPRGFVTKDLPDGCFGTLTSDGIGTKVIPIVASGHPETAANDLIAMGAMDITRYGGMPLVFANIFDVSNLGEKDSASYQLAVKAMQGLENVARQHGYVVLNGETAELGVCVGSEDPNAPLKFNWGGVMYGVYHPEKMILGDTLAPGHVIVALQDNFRSNGISSVRKALSIKYGPDWFKNPEALPDIIAASAPSVQYDRFLNYLHGWTRTDGKQLVPLIKMHLIVHLSGGAFKSKLGEDMLEPQGLSANLDSLFKPSTIMRNCALWRGLSDEDCYSTWNGGQGAIVVIGEHNVSRFLEEAYNYGISAQVAGVIQSRQGYTVRIASKFNGEIITY